MTSCACLLHTAPYDGTVVLHFRRQVGCDYLLSIMLSYCSFWNLVVAPAGSTPVSHPKHTSECRTVCARMRVLVCVHMCVQGCTALPSLFFSSTPTLSIVLFTVTRALMIAGFLLSLESLRDPGERKGRALVCLPHVPSGSCDSSSFNPKT